MTLDVRSLRNCCKVNESGAQDLGFQGNLRALQIADETPTLFGDSVSYQS
jgi:hypothetical protein